MFTAEIFSTYNKLFLDDIILIVSKTSGKVGNAAGIALHYAGIVTVLQNSVKLKFCLSGSL